MRTGRGHISRIKRGLSLPRSSATIPRSTSICNTTRGRLPSIPFERIARAILGPRYDLSIVICGDTLSRRMNIEYRKKTYKPNVLSFPLSKNEGEIFLNMRKAAREAGRFGVSLSDHLAHLFVHGCFHLKGLKHGRIMEDAEQRILRSFGYKPRRD